MRRSMTILKVALVVVMLGVLACATADAQVKKPQRGFWYKGFEPIENPNSEHRPDPNYYWVSPAGDDTNPGTKEKPWKTLTYAKDFIEGGDIVNILPGLYYFDCKFGPAGPYEDKRTIWRAVDQTFKTGRVVITTGPGMVSPGWQNGFSVPPRP